MVGISFAMVSSRVRFPLEVIHQMLGSGQLNPTDLVWSEGMPQWIPAANIPPAGSPMAAPQSPAPVGYYNPRAAGSGASSKGKAIGALTCGIVSLFVCGMITGIIAVKLGADALKEMDSSKNYEGQGMAKAGKVLGIIGIIGWVIVIVFRVGMR